MDIAIDIDIAIDMDIAIAIAMFTRQQAKFLVKAMILHSYSHSTI